jgi:hypothetical protein
MSASRARRPPLRDPLGREGRAAGCEGGTAALLVGPPVTRRLRRRGPARARAALARCPQSSDLVTRSDCEPQIAFIAVRLRRRGGLRQKTAIGLPLIHGPESKTTNRETVAGGSIALAVGLQRLQTMLPLGSTGLADATMSSGRSGFRRDPAETSTGSCALSTNAAASGVELSQDTLDAIDDALGGVVVSEPRLASFAQEGGKAPLASPHRREQSEHAQRPAAA